MMELNKPSELELNGPCIHCPAKCCRNYSVSLTDSDLVRLNKIGIDLLDSILAIPAKGFDSSIAPGVLLSIDPNKSQPIKSEKFILALRRDKTETCLFLGKTNFCMIYPSRPMNCRLYPFRLAQSGHLTYKSEYRCPVNWVLDEKSKEEFKNNVKTHDSELETYRTIVEKWNCMQNQNCSLATFIQFAIANHEDTKES